MCAFERSEGGEEGGGGGGGGAQLKMLPEGDQRLLNPNLGSELGFRVRKRPPGWHVADHVHESQEHLTSAANMHHWPSRNDVL